MSDITDKLRAIYPKYHNLNEWDVRYEAADTIEALRAENARLEKALTELTEENRLVGLQMDRFADEIERLREELDEYKRNVIVDVTGSINYYSGYDEGLEAAAREVESAGGDSTEYHAGRIRALKEKTDA